MTEQPSKEALELASDISEMCHEPFYTIADIARKIDRFAAQHGAIDAAKERLSAYQPLASKARGVAGLALAPDESEIDGASPQTVCHDPPGTNPERTVYHDPGANPEYWMWRDGERIAVQIGEIKSAPPQTGGGDAGRARDLTHDWKLRFNSNSVYEIDIDDLEEEIIAALRDSRQAGYREGAEAMREVCAQICDADNSTATPDPRRGFLAHGEMKAAAWQARWLAEKLRALPIPEPKT